MSRLQLKGLKLMQSQQLQVYLRNIEDAFGWIAEHEMTVSSVEMGSDLERNEVLQKKFDVFVKVCNFSSSNCNLLYLKKNWY